MLWEERVGIVVQRWIRGLLVTQGNSSWKIPYQLSFEQKPLAFWYYVWRTSPKSRSSWATPKFPLSKHGFKRLRKSRQLVPTSLPAFSPTKRESLSLAVRWSPVLWAHATCLHGWSQSNQVFPHRAFIIPKDSKSWYWVNEVSWTSQAQKKREGFTAKTNDYKDFFHARLFAKRSSGTAFGVPLESTRLAKQPTGSSHRTPWLKLQVRRVNMQQHLLIDKYWIILALVVWRFEAFVFLLFDAF